MRPTQQTQQDGGGLKRGKSRPKASQMAFVLIVIGLKSGVKLVSLSQMTQKQ